MTHATTFNLTAGLATEPGPLADRGGHAVPERIGELLDIALILAEYGRHLLDTIEHRAVWSTFATIAQFFGTAVLSSILPRIQRGIMRAVALERVLRARAMRGRDLPIQRRRDPPRAPKPPAAPPPEQAAPSAADGAAPPSPEPPQPPARPWRRRAAEAPLTFNNLPTMKQLEAEARRRTTGQNVVAILCDLGISFSLCSSSFGSRLLNAIWFHRGSLATLQREMRRREKQFEQRHPDLPLPAQSREGIQRAVGFFVGDPPVDPADPGAAPAVANPWAAMAGAAPAPGTSAARPAATGPP